MTPAERMRASEVRRLESFSPVPRRSVLVVCVRWWAGRPAGRRSRVEMGRERRDLRYDLRRVADMRRERVRKPS